MEQTGDLQSLRWARLLILNVNLDFLCDKGPKPEAKKKRPSLVGGRTIFLPCRKIRGLSADREIQSILHALASVFALL
jgi:hypothetical protein